MKNKSMGEYSKKRKKYDTKWVGREDECNW